MSETAIKPVSKEIVAAVRDVLLKGGSWQPPYEVLMNAVVQAASNNTEPAKQMMNQESAFNAMVEPLESLPILLDGIVKQSFSWPAGFILSAARDGWYPCGAMNRTKKGWVEYSIFHTDGSVSTGVAQAGEWADVNADSLPSLYIDMLD